MTLEKYKERQQEAEAFCDAQMFRSDGKRWLPEWAETVNLALEEALLADYNDLPRLTPCDKRPWMNDLIRDTLRELDGRWSNGPPDIPGEAELAGIN